MAAEISVGTVLCILLAACSSQVFTVVTAENDAPSPLAATNPTYSAEQLFVDETIRLITAGESNIRLNASIKDVILLVGKTGTGKTTITKFIAEPEKLEAYNNGDRFLIRDVNREISDGSDNVISKTIFPNLITDESTGNAFYDMPGFSDTRNASIEIANAWFMKTVAEHAQRVKIVFVVTHSSLIHGGNRKDIVTLLKMATDFIKNPSKFQDSISLIATKVNDDEDPVAIIQDVGDFLESVKKVLPSVIEEPIKRDMASDLLDAFLVKYSNGSYSRISFFLQPLKDGPLTTQDDVMELRHYMRRNLDNNTVFVATSPNDFGISLSHDAILSAAKVAQIMNQMIADNVTSIGNTISEHFQGQKPLNSVGSFLQNLGHLEAFVDAFSPSMSRQEFIQQLQVLVNVFKIPELQHQMTFITKRDKNLQFFEQVSQSGAFRPNMREWLRPIIIAIQASKFSFDQMVSALNSQMIATTNKLNSDFKLKIRREVSAIEDPSIRMQRLSNFSQSLQQFITDIPSLGKSYNQFAAQVQSFLIYQGHLTQASEIFSLTDDIPVQVTGCQVQSPLKMSKWLPAFENLLEFVEEEEIKVKMNTLDGDKLKVMRELDTVKGKIQSDKSLLITKGQHDVSLLQRQIAQSDTSYQALLASLDANCNRSREDLLLLRIPELLHLRTTTQAEINRLNNTLSHEKDSTMAEQSQCDKTEAQLRESLNSTINSNKDILKYEQARRVNRTSVLKDQYENQLKAYQERCTKLEDNSNGTCHYLMSENKRRTDERTLYFSTTMDEIQMACNLTLRDQKDTCNQTHESLLKDREDHKILMEGKFAHQTASCKKQIKSDESKCDQAIDTARHAAADNENAMKKDVRKTYATCDDLVLKYANDNQNKIQGLQNFTVNANAQCNRDQQGARKEAELKFDREKRAYLVMWGNSGKCCYEYGGKCLDGNRGTGISRCCGTQGSCGFFSTSCCDCGYACRMP